MGNRPTHRTSRPQSGQAICFAAGTVHSLSGRLGASIGRVKPKIENDAANESVPTWVAGIPHVSTTDIDAGWALSFDSARAKRHFVSTGPYIATHYTLLRLLLPIPKFKRVAVIGKLGGGHEERLGNIDRHQHVEPARRTPHDAELM